MMTKRDFEAIAAIIVQNTSWDDNGIPERIAQDLSAYFATQNPLFDEHRFLEACSV